MIEYSIYATNGPVIYEIDRSLVFSKSGEACSEVELSIVNQDGSALDEMVFSYDLVTDSFTIRTTDISKAKAYPMKLIARVTNDSNSKYERFFTVFLYELCASPTVTATE